jgi:hypothetical protein
LEKVKTAMAEINEQTDLIIDMIEKKEGVQFSVKRKASEYSPSPNRLNPEIAEAALKLGLKLTDIAALIRGGQSELGLKAAFAKMANQDPNTITRKLAYLNKILEEVNPFITDGRTLPVTSTQKQGTIQISGPMVEPLKIAMSFKDERRGEIRREFMQLTREEQRPFAYSGLSELRASKMANPAMSLKVEAGSWETAPMLFSKMVELYAVEKYGTDWGVEQPSTEEA